MNWTKSTIAVNGFDSNSGDFRIIKATNGKWRLVSFIHETADRGLWFKDFRTLQEAKEYAEMI